MEPEADARAHMGQTILVRDNEPMVRRFVVKVGAELGYATLEAAAERRSSGSLSG